MENVPPSYEAATARNPWRIIAPYIPSVELCILNRVNRQLHQVFAPCLWGNPASHFGTENDRVYVALTRFKRVLKRVRLSVRELTHTLHLPPAQSEIYDGPRPEWLRDVLEQLPNLQSLVVSRLPFFDHLALLALRSHSNGRRPSMGDTSPTFTLRLLVAAHCQNTTSQGLAAALDHFPHLTFLDFSNTLAARDGCVLSRLRSLPLLQVLKLRSVHLRDEDVEVLAEAIGIRVRSLDVQGNHLTDQAVRTLLNTCFQVEDTVNGSLDVRPRASSNIVVEDWPSGFVQPDSAVLDEFKDESYDERFVRRLTSGIVSRLPFEDLPQSGITHLYIADNNLTVEGLAALVRSKKLRVLDGGLVSRPYIASRDHPGFAPSDRNIRLPGVEKLTPVLGQCAGNMTSLRLHYTIITETAPPKDESQIPARCELSDEDSRHELSGHVPSELDAAVHELDAVPPLYELDSRNPVPRYELPGDSTHFILSPAIGGKPTLGKDESMLDVRRGSIFAPEVLEQEDTDNEAEPVLTATGLGTMAQAVNGIRVPEISKFAEMNLISSNISNANSEMRLALIERQRQELRSSQLDKPHGLRPGMLPKLRTLTLTNVPYYESGRHIVDALIQFMKDCAAEAELASLQARFQPAPVRKSGQRQSTHNRHGAREIFALKRIVLEMAPSVPPFSHHTTPTYSFSNRTKSSTEDADSEAFWSAAENDFTFFDDDEECGLPAAETGARVAYSGLSEKIIMPTDDPQAHELPTLQHLAYKKSSTDVVQELAAFRKERKITYENAVKRGVPHVNGHWSGEVKVVRGHSLGGNMDYYGNHFEKRGVYR